MWQWLMQNKGNLIIVLILILLIFAVLLYLTRHKKRHCSGCCQHCTRQNRFCNLENQNNSQPDNSQQS